MVKAFRWWWGLLLAFSLLAVSRVFLPLPFVNEVVIFSIYTMGCSFLLGRVGFISFGQPAYLAVGAYGTAFYLFYFGTNPYIGILLGVLSGLVVSCIVGPLFVRLRSDYFALVNLALAVIVYYLMQKVLADITHGDNGLWFLTNIASTPVLDLAKPKPFLHLRFSGRAGRVGVLQVSRRLDLRRLLPRHQDQRRQAQVSRLQQLQRPAARVRHRQYDDRAGRRDVRGLSGFREPGNHQPVACRRSGGGHDTRRGRHALRAHRRRVRLHRHEGRDQQADRQLGTFHRFPAGIHHARRGKGHLGHAAAAAGEAVFPARKHRARRAAGSEEARR